MGFLAGARKAVEAGSVPIDELPTLAEAASRTGTDPALPASLRSRQADELAAETVGWLRRAEAAGYFRKYPNNTELLKPWFDVLRPRPTFRALMADVFFPDDPFAGPP